MSLPWTISRSLSPFRRGRWSARSRCPPGTISPGWSLQFPSMLEHRLPGRRPLFVEFAVGGPQPAQGDRAVVVVAEEGERDEIAGGVDLLEGDEQVQVVAGVSLDPEPQTHMAGEFGLLGEPDLERGPRGGRPPDSSPADRPARGGPAGVASPTPRPPAGRRGSTRSRLRSVVDSIDVVCRCRLMLAGVVEQDSPCRPRGSTWCTGSAPGATRSPSGSRRRSTSP